MMLRRSFMATSAAALLAGCGARGTFGPVAAGTAFDRSDILMVTNRASFDTTDRSDTLSMFDMDIAVPRGRPLGAVPVTGTNAFAVERQRKLEDERQIKRALGPYTDQPLVIWVHGFNNTPAEAVYRHAQMATDTGMGGPQVSFVWPSAATPTGYLHDRDSALQARGSLEDLFILLGRIWSGPVTVIAHSLGCLLVMEALVRMRLQDRAPVLDGIVLLQPDIAPDVFRSQVSDISPLPRNALLVTSADDPALRLSARLAQSPNRVGAAEDLRAYETLGFTVIDLTGIGDARNPHLVALSSPTVLDAMRRRIASAPV